MPKTPAPEICDSLNRGQSMLSHEGELSRQDETWYWEEESNWTEPE